MHLVKVGKRGGGLCPFRPLGDQRRPPAARCPRSCYGPRRPWRDRGGSARKPSATSSPARPCLLSAPASRRGRFASALLEAGLYLRALDRAALGRQALGGNHRLHYEGKPVNHRSAACRAALSMQVVDPRSIVVITTKTCRSISRRCSANAGGHRRGRRGQHRARRARRRRRRRQPGASACRAWWVQCWRAREPNRRDRSLRRRQARPGAPARRDKHR